jgi:hypothetical protein
MANRWISQNNFITGTNIHQPQSRFTIPKMNGLSIKNRPNPPEKYGFPPAPHVSRSIVQKGLHQGILPRHRNGQNRARLFAFGAAMLNYCRGRPSRIPIPETAGIAAALVFAVLLGIRLDV